MLKRTYFEIRHSLFLFGICLVRRVKLNIECCALNIEHFLNIEQGTRSSEQGSNA